MACTALRVVVVGLVLGCFAACGGKPSAGADPAAGPQSLQIVDLKAVLQYTGWLYDASQPEHKGKQFDSSRGGAGPFRFVVGRGEVIKGWDQGVAGMKIGGQRRLIIPPDLAYGDSGAGGVIPPGATLVFDVDLLAIE